MKRTCPALVAALSFAFLCLLLLAACEGNTPRPDPFESAAESEEQGSGQEPESTVAVNSTAEETTIDPTETEPGPVIIQSPDDLMAFNTAVNVDGTRFDNRTILLEANIDMSGRDWVPLDGLYLYNVTFDGQGHTISNLNITHAPIGLTADAMGAGFIGISRGSLTFRDITFDRCHITAYERAVGCIIGMQNAPSGRTAFENVKVTNFRVDGWMDNSNTNVEGGGHPIAFQLAGFVGHNMGGSLFFKNCHVESITLSGYHNLAGFIGYESTGGVDEFCFSDCSVTGASFTFSYCMSPKYTIDQKQKFVSVFYNAANWADSIDPCVTTGNTYANIAFYDWSDDNTEYTPADLRSWSREEAAG